MAHGVSYAATEFRLQRWSILVLSLASLWLLSSCSRSEGDAAQRALAAKEQFEKTVREFHGPAGDKTGPERDQLLVRTAQGYEELLKKFPEQRPWCAQALRNLGNVRLLQGRTNDALRCFQGVIKKYPEQRWEALQAMKSSGDALWETGRTAEAQVYYQQIVRQYGGTNAPQVEQFIVKGARSRLP